jgi:hypothetical protein
VPLSPDRLPRQAGGPAKKDFREWELTHYFAIQFAGSSFFLSLTHYFALQFAFLVINPLFCIAICFSCH